MNEYQIASDKDSMLQHQFVHKNLRYQWLLIYERRKLRAFQCQCENGYGYSLGFVPIDHAPERPVALGAIYVLDTQPEAGLRFAHEDRFGHFTKELNREGMVLVRKRRSSWNGVKRRTIMNI